jgi:hypothetical protein
VKLLQVLPDSAYWLLPNGKLVQYSRHEDPRFKHGGFGGDYPYPAVVPHGSKPNSTNGNVKLTKAWREYVRSINTPQAWKALRRNNGGYANWASNKNFPQGSTIPEGVDFIVEGVTSAGNKHRWLSKKNGWYQLECFGVKDKPPKNITPYSHPHLFVRFTSISRYGVLGNAPDGYWSYFPLLAAKKNGAFVDGRKVKVL